MTGSWVQLKLKIHFKKKIVVFCGLFVIFIFEFPLFARFVFNRLFAVFVSIFWLACFDVFVYRFEGFLQNYWSFFSTFLNLEQKNQKWIWSRMVLAWVVDWIVTCVIDQENDRLVDWPLVEWLFDYCWVVVWLKRFKTHHNSPQLTTTHHNSPQPTTTHHNSPQPTTTYHN